MKNQEYSQKEIEALIPAYGMGMTDADETRQVEAFLRDNPVWQQEVESYRELESNLLGDLPQIDPPAYLLGQILQNITEPTPEPQKEIPLKPPPIISARNRWFLAAVAGLISILGFMALLYTDLREQHASLSMQSTAQVALLQRASRDELISFRLESTDVQDEGRGGVILCNPDERVGVLRTWRFPPLEADQVYQVWLLQGEERFNGGIFQVDADGRSELILYTPDVMGEYNYIGITVEPAGGSHAPTSNPVVRAALYVSEEATDEPQANVDDA